MTRAWVIGDDHRVSYGKVSLRKGSYHATKALSEPAERPQSRPIGFRVSQSRENRKRTSAAIVLDAIQRFYQ